MDDDVRKLIEFLAEDCGWPLEEEQIDRSAWPVNNAELGLNDEVAVDSVEIYELRPLTTHQPWGVFFVAVKGTSILSMSLLRKLLRGLVKKKRASADTSNLQQWNLEDLMFVCSLDEPENTTRYFAHFKEQEKGLPKLMIGARWQDSQPESEIKAAKLKLKSNLKWPDNEANIDSWREQWGKAFPIGHKEVIRTSSNLANALAKYAVIIKRNIPDIYSIESDNGPVHRLFEAFKEALISDLKIGDFADMVAQTITYGLFSARATGSELMGIETLSECIPATNPFLKDLFTELATLSGAEPTDLDFDDLAIDELISMLNRANIESVMNDFGSQFKGGKEDPVIHFYETFLSNYDNVLRAERGVFYTPKSVVYFIVRTVHERLIVDHELTLGLADTTTHIIDGKVWPKVMILDPATGTGTFLEAAIEIIHETMLSHWEQEGKGKSEIHILWNEYVDKDLLPRLYGFELMMAPYSVAHLKIGLKLQQTGYDSDSGNRLNVYLTNTLAEPAPLSSWIPDFISIESSNANSAKQDIPFSVVIGNPPYLAASANENPWIRNLMRTKLSDGADSYFRVDGADLGERNPRWINDDYVKFMRYSQFLLARSGFGVFGFVTNHGYINNPTFRGVRQSWMHSFQRIALYDLHGNSKKKEKNPDGGVDENMFDIQQGVAINISTMKKGIQSSVFHTDLWGARIEKSAVLAKPYDIQYQQVIPESPFYLFVPMSDLGDYLDYWPLTRILSTNNTGIISKRDSLAFKFDKDEVQKVVEDIYNLPEKEILKKYPLKSWSSRDGKVEFVKESVLRYGIKDSRFIEILYRPFDKRWTYYTPKSKGFIAWPVYDVMQHMFNEHPLALITARSNKSQSMDHFFITRLISETKCGEASTQSGLFVVYDKNGNSLVNKHLTAKLFDLHKVSDIDVVHYIYALFYSNSYRSEYGEMIMIDFPKIPFTTNTDLFRELSHHGADLAALHLLEADYEFASWVKDKLKSPFDTLSCKYEEGTNQRIVGSVSKAKAFEDGNVFTDTSSIVDCSKFINVPEDVWNFTIGGYQVCHKWLKYRRRIGDRKGRLLTDEDILHFRRMIKSIECTLDLMGQIDEVIEEHGGWPLEGSDEFEVPGERDENQTGLFDF